MGVVTCPCVLPSFFVEDDYLKTFSAHINAYKHMGACDNQDCLVEEKWCASVTIKDKITGKVTGRKNHRVTERQRESLKHRRKKALVPAGYALKTVGAQNAVFFIQDASVNGRVLDENNSRIMLGSDAHGSRRFMRCLTPIYCASFVSRLFDIVFSRVAPRLRVDILWLLWYVVVECPITKVHWCNERLV